MSEDISMTDEDEKGRYEYLSFPPFQLEEKNDQTTAEEILRKKFPKDGEFKAVINSYKWLLSLANETTSSRFMSLNVDPKLNLVNRTNQVVATGQPLDILGYFSDFEVAIRYYAGEISTFVTFTVPYAALFRLGSYAPWAKMLGDTLAKRTSEAGSLFVI